MLDGDLFLVSDYRRWLHAERRGEGHERVALGVLLGLAGLADGAAQRPLQLGEEPLRVLDPLHDPRLDRVAEAVYREVEVIARPLTDRFTVDLGPVPFGVGEETEDSGVGRPDHSPIRSLLIVERMSMSIPSRSRVSTLRQSLSSSTSEKNSISASIERNPPRLPPRKNSDSCPVVGHLAVISSSPSLNLMSAVLLNTARPVATSYSRMHIPLWSSEQRADRPKVSYTPSPWEPITAISALRRMCLPKRPRVLGTSRMSPPHPVHEKRCRLKLAERPSST